MLVSTSSGHCSLQVGLIWVGTLGLVELYLVPGVPKVRDQPLKQQTADRWLRRLCALQSPWQPLESVTFSLSSASLSHLLLAQGALGGTVGLQSWCFSAALSHRHLEKTWAFHLKPLSLHPISDQGSFHCCTSSWAALATWAQDRVQGPWEVCAF